MTEKQKKLKKDTTDMVQVNVARISNEMDKISKKLEGNTTSNHQSSNKTLTDADIKQLSEIVAPINTNHQHYKDELKDIQESTKQILENIEKAQNSLVQTVTRSLNQVEEINEQLTRTKDEISYNCTVSNRYEILAQENEHPENSGETPQKQPVKKTPAPSAKRDKNVHLIGNSHIRYIRVSNFVQNCYVTKHTCYYIDNTQNIYHRRY